MSNIKTGRPRKEIDRRVFESFCAIQCTQREICDYFEVTDKTLNAWCKRTYGMGFSDIFKIKKGKGKISLRRMQFRLAEKSPAMAIFLGKNILGQSDYPDDRGEDAIKAANEQTLTLADLLNNPAPDVTFEEVLNEDEAEDGDEND